MSAVYHHDLIQGTDDWIQARNGLLTASEMKLILTPTRKIANNDKTRAHVYEIAAQRISGFTEQGYMSYDMERGIIDEVAARELYGQHCAPIIECGFVTGRGMGYSPDGLVGDDGLIEIKSRLQKYQIKTVCENCIPEDYILQIQTGLLITGRKWLDFISYSAGLPMVIMRAYPDTALQGAILEAATQFEAQVQDVIDTYTSNITPAWPKTERKPEQEIPSWAA
jgi:predicted phage-related endonuclease